MRSIGFRGCKPAAQGQAVAIQSATQGRWVARACSITCAAPWCSHALTFTRRNFCGHRAEQVRRQARTQGRDHDQFVKQHSPASAASFARSRRGDYRWLVVRLTYSCSAEACARAPSTLPWHARYGLAPPSLALRYAAPLDSIPAYNATYRTPASAPVVALTEAIRAADGLIIVSPEYNWSIPGG